MDGGDGFQATLHRVLLERFQSLEASHQKLRQQFEVLLQERMSANNATGAMIFRENEVISDTSFPGWGRLPDSCILRNPYRSVLEYMGHAVHVSRTGSWEIVYWNCAAEKLYGYKEYEVVGQRAVKLLFDEEYRPSALAIMERLRNGESWSGQLPLKKRSGQNFMAMVTKSPLYEDGELVGIVTVSSDAAVFNNTNSENTRTDQDHANERNKFRRINLKKIQWHPKPQIVQLPQVPSSISNLASKVLLRKRGDAVSDSDRSTRESEESEVESQDVKADGPPRAPIAKPASSLSIRRSETEAMSSEKEESTSEVGQPSKIAVKLFSKLQIGAISNLMKVMDESIQHKRSGDDPTRNEAVYETCSQRDSMESTHINNLDASNHIEDAEERNIKYKAADHLQNIKSLDSEDASPIQLDSHKTPNSGGSFGSGTGSSSSKGYNDSHAIADPAIRWEDLQLREELGQGSFAVVYHGLWNGSDVAVKVYFGNQYTEQTLLDYKKEIDIIRRLRHPNVLLFMGAVCTEEKLAMVTEYLTRGSLFKTLHRSNRSLDIRRRLRMAIDVARGMNYLHHRNPPIVHRDLKSSNLLVDKSWTVKVGDFGLSKLKCATFVTAKSGRGTPQWMAPEVLRNEPSTEKSDIFSFGVILWELMTERIPWSDLNSLQVVGFVGFMDRRLDLPENIDPRVSSIISDCWRSNPEDRPSFEDILHKMTELVHPGGGIISRTLSEP